MSSSNSTVFFTEGGTIAVRQAENADDQLEAIADLTTPEDALAWCRANGVTFVYLPAQPSESGN